VKETYYCDDEAVLLSVVTGSRLITLSVDRDTEVIKSLFTAALGNVVV